MESFSMVAAWQSGIRFIAAKPRQFLLLIAGLGVLLPFAVQLLLFGAAALTGQAPAAAAPASPAQDAAAAIVMIAAFVWQVAIFFAAWRLGFAARESFGGALLYGIVAGLLAVVASVLLFAAAGMAASQAGSPGIAVFVILFTLLPVILALATFWTLMSALVGTGLALLLTLTMAFGTSTGDMGLAATMVGGSGFVVVMLLVLSALLLWLAARLSCTTAVMADTKSYNLFSAMRASWELTWEAQWLIMAYLALLGLATILVMVGLVVAIGGGAGMMMQGSVSPAAAGIGGLVFALLLGLVFAFLAVMLPAGIYRQLVGVGAPVEVFA